MQGERRILKRKKERQDNGSGVGSKKGKFVKVKETLSNKTRFHPGWLNRRKPVLSPVEQKMSVEITTMIEKKEKKVNPVLIWRQQAAVAEQEPRMSGSGRSAGRGRGRSRRRKINRDRSGHIGTE